MVMVRYLTIMMLSLLVAAGAYAQSGSIKGVVIDEVEDETVPFANVSLKQDGILVTGTTTDFDGNYNISNVKAGTYDLELSFVGYPTVVQTGVVIKIGQVTNLDLFFPEPSEENGGGITGPEIVYVEYKIPLIEQDNTTSGQTIGAEDIAKQATRNVNSLAATTAGVNQQDEGEEINSNGARSSGNDTYIDGVRVFGNVSLPETEIEQVQIITSGVPAEFGDATGAIINIVTKGPSRKFTGGVQMETSQYLDAFGFSRADLYFAGPIVSRPAIAENGDTLKDKDGEVMREPIVGYRMAGTITTTRDNRPSALPSFKVKDDVVAELQANPLIRTETGGLVLATDFLTEDDIEEVAVRPNARNSSALFNGKIDFKPTDEFFIDFGGQMQYEWGNEATVLNRLLNYDFNRDFKRSNWRAYGRFRHTVTSTIPKDNMAATQDSTAAPSYQPVFQNFSYEIQGDYTRSDFSIEDPRYRDRLFEYGYVGRVSRSLTPVIGVIDTNFITNSVGDTVGTDLITGHSSNFITFNGFEASDINAGLAAYNNLLDYSEITSMEELEITNGRFIGNRLSAFSLFTSPHNAGGTTTEGAGFGKSNSTQVRGNLKANFDLVMNQKTGNPIRHAITMGGVYEQRVERSYSISPFALWTLADQSANSHLSFATDINRPDGGEYFDPNTQRFYATYDPLIREDEDGNLVQMTQFGEEVREALTAAGEGTVDQYDWVNVHDMTPDQLDLSFFEPTTLINGRQQVMSYFGYDYLGNPLGSSVDFNDFFTAEDATTGRKTRPVAPFSPIYIAGYLQDKFTYKDIICRIGVRFDSYDANTKVLRDPYSVAGYYTADEFFSNGVYAAADNATKPANIGDDYAVYVSNNSSDASIAGYRSGDQWFDADGVPINDPGVLGQTIVPALQGFSTAQNDTKGEEYDPELAFRDYTPSLVIMPRISFSFPINENANFYANYDVLAMRPPDGSFASALTYFNFVELATSSSSARFIPNPNLKPQRTINYEVGFQQKLNNYSKVKLSLLYREERDLIQLRQYAFAYPVTYQTYGNDDFSTVKAFKLEYDLRENKNVRVLANYTLQFAEGTGSSPTSSQNIAAQELAYVFPLNFDQRHTFFLNFDYRYKDGKDYTGPKIYRKSKSGDSTTVGKAINILENTGLNVSFNASSGTPYTRRLVPGGIGTSFPNRITEGSINGARTPWNFRIDLRLDKDFVIGKNSKTPIYMNVYLRVQNLLNTQNVLAVYSATGSPTDDGFLTTEGSPGLNLLASNPMSYEMLYNLRMNNPFNISRPRRIFLGVKFGF